MSPTLTALFSVALRLAALASFCVLLAGAQVPSRLRWKEELARLSPFNRKMMWTYYGFIGGSIVAFGILTLALHDEMLHGDRSALALCAFMGLWWTARIVVDALWYSHADWPAGRAFVVGHALLTSAFVAMAATYLGVVAAHFLVD